MKLKGGALLKTWEIFLLATASLLFLASFGVYISGYPLRDWVFGSEESTHESIGQISRAEGSLRREQAAQAEFTHIGLHAGLYPRDLIVTGSNSHAEVTLADGSTIELAPLTMIRLESESRHNLTGVSRTVRVQIVNGAVQSKVARHTRSKLLIVRHDEEIDVSDGHSVQADSEKPMAVVKPVLVKATKAVPVVSPTPLLLSVPLSVSILPSTLPSPTPSPTPSPVASPLPSPIPSPTLSPIPDVQPKVTVTLPRNGAKFSVAPGSPSPVAVVPMQVTMALPSRQAKDRREIPKDLSSRQFRVLLRVYHLAEEGGKRTVVLEQPLTVSIETPARLNFQAHLPGRYRAEVSLDNGAPNGESSGPKPGFSVLPDFEAIRVQQPEPLVEKGDGSEMPGNTVMLRWAPYPAAASYKVRTFRNGKTIEEVTVSDTHYSVKRAVSGESERSYRVSAKLPNGWIVHSPVDRLVFDFTPPLPVTPANHKTLDNHDTLSQGSGILLTWRKTGVGDSYLLKIADDPAFRHVLVNKKQSQNFTVFKPATQDTQYYWRVQAIVNGAISRPSETFEFSVKYRK